MSAFVGRHNELAALAEITRAGLRGTVAVGIVVGDPGAGKSRLMAEAAARAPVRNQFSAVGFEPESAVPLGSVSELLRALASAGQQGRRLEELVFGAAFDDASRLEPIRVFEAAHRALQAVGPSLVLIDDVQWMDDLSLALCHYLVRAAETTKQPLGLIAATRPSPNATSFAASLRQLLPAEHVAEIDLRPLGEAESLELVRQLAPGLGDKAARVLADKAGGSPFWLEALVGSGAPDVDAGRLVTARLRGAGADAATLLALLAITARPLALADAAELNRWDEERVEQAARELVTRGIAVESGGVIRPAHDLIRAAAAREIPDERRVRIHRRVSDWLVESAGDDIRRLREALDHRHAAGLGSLELAERLVRSPQRTLLGDDGLALLEAITDEADPFDETALSVNEQVAGLASVLGRHNVALERNLVLAGRLRDPLRQARALLEATRAAFALDRTDQARLFLDRARALDTHDEILDVELDVEQAALDLWGAGRKERGRVLAHEAASWARRLFEVDDRARGAYLEALRVEHEAAYQEDDAEAMVRTAEERAAAARGFADEAHLTALLASARALRRLGRLDQALERAQRVYREARQRVLPRLALDAGYWLGTFLLQSGRLSDAREVVSGTAELASRIGDEARGRHKLDRLASEIDFHGGEWRSGVDGLLAYACGASEHARIELHHLAALWLALAGGRELGAEVVAQLTAARACADVASCPRCATELRLAAADALAHVGQRAEAAQSLAEWLRMQARPQPRDRHVQRRVEALVQEPAAIGLLEAAARDARELGFGLDALWTRLDLGTALAASDPTRAKDVLRAVADAASENGVRTVAELAAKRLRELGVRTWRRGAAHGAALTQRERAIARLVAEGASNPEIAQQLFLSRKTVERHVSNVLRKIGARNRADLAARVAELQVEGAHR